MENAKLEIKKSIFLSFFIPFVFLAFIFVSMFIFDLIYNLFGGEWLLIILPISITFWVCMIPTIIFYKLFFKFKKQNEVKRFVVMSMIAIIVEMSSIFLFYNYEFENIVNRDNYNKITKLECSIVAQADSYDDCINMKTECMEKCTNVVYEKKGDLKGCIDNSIAYAQKESPCLRWGRKMFGDECKKGFQCIEKRTIEEDGTNKSMIWIGYSDGTYKGVESIY